jgi:hypothetical protein
MCKWVHLPSKDDPTERRCSAEGTPYCEEHAAEIHYHTWLLELKHYTPLKPGPRLVRTK